MEKVIVIFVNWREIFVKGIKLLEFFIGVIVKVSKDFFVVLIFFYSLLFNVI